MIRRSTFQHTLLKVVDLIKVIPLGLTLIASDLHAQYSYISDDPYVAHRKLVIDIQSSNVDSSNFGPAATRAVTQESIFSATPRRLQQLGSLNKICFTFALKYENGRRFILRTLHENGCADWVIIVSAKPEVVETIVMIPRQMPIGQTDVCGPPAVLPPDPSATDFVILPPRITCADVDAVLQRAPPEDEAKACLQFPALCKRQQ
jgi:hypothetical protein